jgi:diguanylate cyclase (GGDEF)-like protein/PAS domain S-box-containing protein
MRYTETTQLEEHPGDWPLTIPSFTRLVSVGLFLIALAAVASLLNVSSWNIGGVTILWPANGFLLGVILCAPRRQWVSYLLLGFLVDLAVNHALGQSEFISTYDSFSNLLEVLVAGLLLRPIISPSPDLTRRNQLVSLLFYGVIVAPAAASLFAASYANGHFTLPTLRSFQHWFTADALGIAIVTPLYLSFQQRRHFAGRSWAEVAALFSLLAITTIAVFTESRFPLLFLITPCLLYLGMRLRIAGSAMGLLLVAVFGGIFTSHGYGPLMLIRNGSVSSRTAVLQFFLAVSMVMLYVIEVIISESSSLQLSLRASETRFRLLAETSRDVIVLSDLNGTRRYVSPAIQELLGWAPEELVGERYSQIVHPDDVPRLEQVLAHCRSGKPYNTLEYRCRRTDGTYLWMEANLRLYTDPGTGEPVGFVNVVRDIASRKAAEEQLHRAFNLAESLASIDGLTGLANRRRLDETLDVEWRRAMRDRSPISLLLLDVDHFKAYNDLYGHVKGDACLRQVADCARSVIHRSADLLARYGGEEFVVVLPNTESEGAHAIAEQIRLAIEQLNIPHRGNTHQKVTVSVGCATHSPQLETTSDLLIMAADQALYQAKAMGRNRIRVTAGELSPVYLS